MITHALILCGFSYRKNNYSSLIQTAPHNWKFHEFNYFDVLTSSSNNRFSEGIKKYLNNLHINKVSIIAHSLGGAYAIDFAYHHPEMVKNIYLLNTVGIKHKYLLFKFIQLSIKNKRNNFSKHFIDDIKGLSSILKTPVRHLRLLKYVEGMNLEVKAAKIKANTTLIWGEDDYLLPLSDAKKLNNLIKNSKLITLKNTGHDWPLYSPELFWKNIED